MSSFLSHSYNFLHKLLSCPPARFGRVQLRLMACVLVLSQLHSSPADAKEEDRFSDFEIRVIRPKYFTKSFRFEVGVQASAIFNHPFIYTYMGNANTTFHFNEALALEASGFWGLSLDRQAKETLNNNYSIKTIIHRTQHIAIGSLLWTPFYGKFQTASNKLIYFDLFITGGGGITGINYQYDHCVDDNSSTLPIEKKTVNYPTLSTGLGQKVFLNKNVAIRWDITFMAYSIKEADGSCAPSEETVKEDAPFFDFDNLKNNFVFKIGVSRFF